MSLRVALMSDAEALAALHCASFETGWDPAMFSDFINTDLVLVSGEPIDAFIIVRQTLDEAEIITLLVAPHARLLGKAGALLAAAFEKLSVSKAFKIFLEVAADNEPAKALYRQAGFTQIGVRRGYYSRGNGQNMDALVMSVAFDHGRTVSAIATDS